MRKFNQYSFFLKNEKMLCLSLSIFCEQEINNNQQINIFLKYIIIFEWIDYAYIKKCYV